MARAGGRQEQLPLLRKAVACQGEHAGRGAVFSPLQAHAARPRLGRHGEPSSIFAGVRRSSLWHDGCGDKEVCLRGGSTPAPSSAEARQCSHPPARGSRSWAPSPEVEGGSSREGGTGKASLTKLS